MFSVSGLVGASRKSPCPVIIIITKTDRAKLLLNTNRGNPRLNHRKGSNINTNTNTTVMSIAPPTV